MCSFSRALNAFIFTSKMSFSIFAAIRKDGRVVKCTGLENRQGFVALLGFESLSLRHILWIKPWFIRAFSFLAFLSMPSGMPIFCCMELVGITTRWIVFWPRARCWSLVGICRLRAEDGWCCHISCKSDRWNNSALYWGSVIKALISAGSRCLGF